jgi:hypothetical protein
VPAFSDVSDFLAEVNGEPLDLPVRGKVFRFSGSPPFAQVAELREIQRKLDAQRRGEIPADTVVVPSEDEFYERLIAEQAEQMAAAGVTTAEKGHVALTILVYYTQGADAAERYWTGTAHKEARERLSGEAAPTGTTTAPPKAKRRPSDGGTPTTASGRSSKPTSPAATASA